MEPKLTPMNQESWHTAETAATRTLMTALVTGVCGWFANWFRLRIESRKEQKAMAESVAAVRDVVNPSGPDRPDLGARVEAVERATERLSQRMDENIQQQQE